MPTYTLPDLAYDPAALEPHISGAIIQLHHDKHHAAYVTGANQTLDALSEAQKSGDFGRIAALEKALAFHVSGHVLHSIYWKNLTPKGGDKPTGALAAAIDKDFGSFDAFKKQLNGAASTIMGSGWGLLVYEPVAQKLITVSAHDHQSEGAQGSVVLMALDAWEHAWYLQYKNVKADYFAAIWNLWNWADIAERYESATKLVTKI